MQLVQLLQRSKVTPETLRKWVKQFEIDNGDKTGVTTAEQEEIKRLKKEVLKLQQTQEILLAASAFFAKTVPEGH